MEGYIFIYTLLYFTTIHMETRKTFLLDLSKSNLDMLDVYCWSKNITRTEFFRQLFNSWLLANASDIWCIADEISNKSNDASEKFKSSLEKMMQMMHALMPAPNYLDHYRYTELYKVMTDKIQFGGEQRTPPIEEIMPYEKREELKEFWDTMIKYWFVDSGFMLKDMSHWQRYLEHNPKNPKNFLEYVDRKYTNPDLKSY
jgi:hypothetical protein